MSAYDKSNERLLFTKRDIRLADDITSLTDYHSTTVDGKFILFEDYQQTIEDYESQGYSYEGIIGGKMIFSLTEFNGDNIIEEEVFLAELPDDATILLYTDKEYTVDTLYEFYCTPMLNYFNNVGSPSIGEDYPNWRGNFIEVREDGDPSNPKNWLANISDAITRLGVGSSPTDEQLKYKNVVIINLSVLYESYMTTPALDANPGAPNAAWQADHATISTLFPKLNSFRQFTWSIPVVDPTYADAERSKAAFQQNFLALLGAPIPSNIPYSVNQGFTPAEEQLVRDSGAISPRLYDGFNTDSFNIGADNNEFYVLTAPVPPSITAFELNKYNRNSARARWSAAARECCIEWF